MKKLILLTTALMTTATFADLNVSKISTVFPDAQVMEYKEVTPGFYEVQMKPNDSAFKRMAIYTNENVDFVTSQFNTVKGAQLLRPTPDFGYDNIDLTKHATFVSGSGDKVRYVFVNPLSPEGLPGLEDVLKDTKHTNYIFIHFDKTDSAQSYLMLPFYYGDTSERLQVAKDSVTLFRNMAYGKITEQEAQRITGDKIEVIKDAMTNDRVDTLVDGLRGSMELAEIVASGSNFVIYDENKKDITPKPKEIKKQPQTITAFDFKAYGDDVNNKLLQYYTLSKSGKKVKSYDFSDVENFHKVIEDATAYKVGNGKKEVLLFTDIDCPYCVRLEQAIDKYLSPDVTVRVMFYPIQGLHPNALDKHRHILSATENQRHDIAIRIRGENNNGLESKTAISDLTAEQLKPIDEVISKSFTLGNLFNVVGTPTVMTYENGVIKNLPNTKSILSIKQ